MPNNKLAIVFLHGSGSSGIDIRTFFDSIPLESFGHKTFSDVLNLLDFDLVTPSANERYYTACGDVSRVWYDRSPIWQSAGIEDIFEDRSGIEASLNGIESTIASLPHEYVILGGLSMGGGLALYSLSRTLSSKVVGTFSMGSFVVNSSFLYDCLRPDIANISVLMLHGTDDDLVLPAWGRHTASKLHLAAVNVQFVEVRETGHEIGEEELHRLLDWIESIMGSQRSRRLPQEAAATSSEGPGYTILPQSDGSVIVTYHVPENTEDVLTSNPVMVCGGVFEIKKSAQRGLVTVQFRSAQPEKTALEIGKRLARRITSGAPTPGDVCPMS